MDAAIVIALFALGGTVVGGAIAVIAPIVTARINARSKRAELAVTVGLRQWELLMEHARRSGGGQVLPAVAYVHFASRIVELLEDGSLSAATYAVVQQEQENFQKVILDDPINAHVARKGGA
jgi:hypothetical protein